MTGILAGVQVLDFGRYHAGPYCASLLGDLGADVIRIERVGGGEDRLVVPLAAEEAGAGFLQSNRNKRSLTLDPTTPEGRKIVRELITRADIVVANLPAQGLAAMGLDYQSVRKLKADIILTTVSAFGSIGPWHHRIAFDGVAQAMSGLCYMTGQPGAPQKFYGPWVDFAVGTKARVRQSSWRFGQGLNLPPEGFEAWNGLWEGMASIHCQWPQLRLTVTRRLDLGDAEFEWRIR